MVSHEKEHNRYEPESEHRLGKGTPGILNKVAGMTDVATGRGPGRHASLPEGFACLVAYSRRSVKEPNRFLLLGFVMCRA